MSDGELKDRLEGVELSPLRGMAALKPIIIDQRRFKRAGQSIYRVYSAPGEYNLVEAESAHEAFQKSGMSKVFKIERENFYRYVSLDQDLIEKREESNVETSVDLPEAEEFRKILMVALTDEMTAKGRAIEFEEVALGGMHKKAAPVPSPQEQPTLDISAETQNPALAESSPVPDVLSEASVQAPQETPSSEMAADEELSPEAIEALLNPGN